MRKHRGRAVASVDGDERADENPGERPEELLSRFQVGLHDGGRRTAG